MILLLFFFFFTVFVDFQKAIDTIHHDILLNKLNHCDIRGNEMFWFKT